MIKNMSEYLTNQDPAASRWSPPAGGLKVNIKVWTVTSVRVASFDVAGDADHCQCVDAAQTKHQREETVHLEEANRTGCRCVPVQCLSSSIKSIR